MNSARKKLLEHFDDEVREKLKIRGEDHQLPENSKNGQCWTNKETKQTRQFHPLIQSR